MLNFSGKPDQEALDQIFEIVKNLPQSGSVIFTIDRDPESILRNAWEATNGKFTCFLLEQNGEERKVRIDPPKTCCGTCH
jgi:hypothetical protein